MKVNKYLADLAASEESIDNSHITHLAQENSGGGQEGDGIWGMLRNSPPGEFLFGNKEAEHIFQQRRKQNQMKHIAGVAGTAVALPFLARAIMSRNTEKERKRRNEMLQRAAVARNPIIELDSPGLDVAQLGQSDEDQRPGYQDSRLISTAQEGKISLNDLGSEAMKLPLNLYHTMTGHFQSGADWTYPLLALSVLAGGTALGAKWADKDSDKRRAEELDEQLKQAKKRLDSSQFRALAQQRGIPYPEEEQEKQAGEGLDKTAGVMAGIGQTVPILAGILALGGYYGGKELAKSTAPDKVKAYKELKNSLRNQIYGGKPAELYLSSGSDMRKLFGPTTTKERKKRQEEIPASGLTIDV